MTDQILVRIQVGLPNKCSYGEMVDIRGLKPLVTEVTCEFKSHCEYQKEMENWQSGLLWLFAKQLSVKAPQVRILYFPPKKLLKLLFVSYFFI